MTGTGLVQYSARAGCYALLFASTFGSLEEASAQFRTGDSTASFFSINAAIRDAEQGRIDRSARKLVKLIERRRPVSTDGQRVGMNSLGSRKQSELAERFLRLHELWIQHEADPVESYELWKELVFPGEQLDVAFAYPTNVGTSGFDVNAPIDFDFPEPHLGASAVDALVDWAVRSDRLEDLRREITQREQHQSAAEVTLLAEIQIANHASTPIDTAEQLCQTLTSKPARLLGGAYAELLCGKIWRLAGREGMKASTRDRLSNSILVGTRVLSRNRSFQIWSQNPWLQYLVARELNEAIENGDAFRFRLIKGIAMTRYASITALNQDLVKQHERALMSQADRRARDAGHAPFIDD